MKHPSDRPVTYSLTSIQKSMLFQSLADPRSGTNVDQVIGTLHESLDQAAFKLAWQRLVDRHEALRMRFMVDDNSKASQFSLDEATLSLDEHDWSKLSSQEREQLFETFLKDDRVRGFDHQVGMLFRVALFRMGELDYRFIFTSWKGILDDRARLILLQELFRFYEAFQNGEDLNLQLPRSYTDYIKRRVAHDMAPSEPYWKELLTGFTEPTPAGLHRMKNSHESGNFGKHETYISQALTSQLQAAARTHEISVNTLIQGAWALVLSQFSGQDDVVFGTIRECRHSAFDGDGAGEEIVGCLINMLPVRVKISEGVRVLDWLKDLQTQLVAQRSYENASHIAVQKYSGVPQDQQFFHSIVVYNTQRLESALCSEGDALTSRLFETRGQSRFPITVYAYGEPDLLLEIANDRAYVDDPTAERLLAHLAMAIQSLTEQPDTDLIELQLLPVKERWLLLEEWNRTKCPFPKESSIQHSFAEMAARKPDAPALTCCSDTWTFHQLDQKAEEIASQLREAGARPETVVGICMERCLDLVAGMLGILKTGAAYMPLDPSYPQDRLHFMIEDARPLVVVSNQLSRDRLSAADVPVYSVDEDNVITESNVFHDHKRNSHGGHNLAYVIYTSGSTGKPKGVMVEQQNVMNLFTGMDLIYGRDPGVCLAVTSISFDPSVLDLLWSLTRGYHVILWPGMERENAMSIPNLIQTYAVTHLANVPSFLRMIMLLPGGIDALSSLRRIMVGGEALSPILLRDLGPSISQRIVNAYGPTETTVLSTAWDVDSKAQSLPIGRPIVNTQTYVLDRYRRPVPIGVVGELYIGGAGVTRGYLNRPELTNEKFIPNPFDSSIDGRLYRTGDLARYRSDGMLEFVGRIDEQVKIRGFRVELGEIEKVLSNHADINAAVVAMQHTEEGGNRLVAYVVPGPKGMPTTKKLRNWVGMTLPSYMVPAVFVELEEIPRTSNGKMDRKALPAPVENSGTLHGEGRTPTPIEVELMEIWCEVLHRKQVGLNENFFDIGGDSLMAIAMIVAIEKHFDVNLPLEELLIAQTVETINDLLVDKLNVERIDDSEPQTETERKLHAIWERLLDVRPIGIHDNFFELRGNSALFDQMLTEIRENFDVFVEGLPVSAMHKNPTIKALSQIINEATKNPVSQVVCLQPNGPNSPLFLIHAGGGGIFFYRPLAMRLGPDIPVYAVRGETSFDGMGNPFHKSTSLEEVAARYIDEIKTVQPTGPYLIGGASFGGIIAFEMAQQLQSQGEKMAGPVLLFDTFIMNNPQISREEESAIFQKAGIERPETLGDIIARHLRRTAQFGLINGMRYAFGKIWRHAPWFMAATTKQMILSLRSFFSKLNCKLRWKTKKSGGASSTIELTTQIIGEEFANTSARLCWRYKPRTFEGSVVLFRSSENDPEPLWAGLAREKMVVHLMPGDHLDMMEEPAVTITASLVRETLKEPVELSR